MAESLDTEQNLKNTRTQAHHPNRLLFSGWSRRAAVAHWRKHAN
jgi:hypothetical protein